MVKLINISLSTGQSSSSTDDKNRLAYLLTITAQKTADVDANRKHDICVYKSSEVNKLQTKLRVNAAWIACEV